MFCCFRRGMVGIQECFEHGIFFPRNCMPRAPFGIFVKRELEVKQVLSENIWELQVHFANTVQKKNHGWKTEMSKVGAEECRWQSRNRWFHTDKLDTKDVFGQGTNIPQSALAENTPLMVWKKNSPLKMRASSSDELHLFIMQRSLKLYGLSSRCSKII